jgi:hypothetical protein
MYQMTRSNEHATSSVGNDGDRMIPGDIIGYINKKHQVAAMERVAEKYKIKVSYLRGLVKDLKKMKPATQALVISLLSDSLRTKAAIHMNLTYDQFYGIVGQVQEPKWE